MLPFAGVFKWLRHDAFRITVPRICAVGLAILAGVVYFPFLANPLIFDDFNVLGGGKFFDYAFYFSVAPRWFPFATLAHTHLLTNGSIPAMRLGNLALHAANVVAVFVLLRAIFVAAMSSDGTAQAGESNALAVALFGAAMFAVNPVAVYGAGYLVQRSILMSTLFMLLMLIAYLRWLTTGRSALWVWSAGWYLLSVFSKEHSVMAPAVALLLTPLVHRPSAALIRSLIAPFATYAVIALTTILMVKGVIGSAYEPMAQDMFQDMQGRVDAANNYPLSIVTQAVLFFKYMLLWVYPNVGWMSVDMREPFATSLLAWPYGVATIAFVAYGAMAVSMVSRGGRVGMAGWLLAYPWLMFATELSTVRVQEPFVLYRAYLWFPLFGALAPLALWRLNTKALIAISIPVLCVLVALSWNRLTTLSDTLVMWEGAARLLAKGDEPGAGRIYYNRALALSGKGRNAEALVDMDRVIELHPKLAPVHYTRAKIRFESKQYTKAMQDLTESIALNPKYAGAYLARAITLQRLGRDDEALPDLNKSCEFKDIIGCFALDQHAKKQAKQ